MTFANHAESESHNALQEKLKNARRFLVGNLSDQTVTSSQKSLTDFLIGVVITVSTNISRIYKFCKLFIQNYCSLLFGWQTLFPKWTFPNVCFHPVRLIYPLAPNLSECQVVLNFHFKI